MSDHAEAATAQYQYINNLTGLQSSYLTYSTLIVLLSSPLACPRLISLGTSVYTASYGSEWKTVRQDADLCVACSYFYYVKRDGSVNDVAIGVSALAALMENGEVDGMTSVLSHTYPIPAVGGGGEPVWNQIVNLVKLRRVLQLIEARNDKKKAASNATEEVDQSQMVFNEKAVLGGQAEDELKAFLANTGAGVGAGADGSDDVELDESSMLPPVKEDEVSKPTAKKPKKRKTGASNFTAKSSKKWVYVTGLPPDSTESEIAAHFAKAGVLDISPEDQQPRVKLYTAKNDQGKMIAKGDASICYAREESVELALSIIDGTYLRADGSGLLVVKKAEFQQKGEVREDNNKKFKTGMAQRKVAKLASQQTMSWDVGDNGRISGGLKGLTIVVLKGMFTLRELREVEDEDVVLGEVETGIREWCREMGSVEKITIFSENSEGVVVVKFKEVQGATLCVKELNGKAGFRGGGGVVKASFWDGVSDYTVKKDVDEERREEEERLEEFGSWLDGQEEELPEELRTRVG